MEHEDEDACALEAALAFLDDWAKLDEASEATSGSCDGEGASPAGEVSPEPKKSATKPRRRSTADKRKDEIRQLREQFEVLKKQEELMRLTKEWQKRARASAVELPGRFSSGLAKREQVAAAWKIVITKHKRLREASEAENDQLKAAVTKQRRVVASIQKLLRRHVQGTQVVQTPIVTPGWLPSAVEFPDDNFALNKICLEMEAACFSKSDDDLAVMFGGCQLFPGKQIKQVSPTKIIAMLRCSWVLPYGFSQVSSAAYSVVQVYCSPPSNSTQKLPARETHFRSYTLGHQFGGFSYSLCANSALRVRADAERVGFVSAGVSRPFLINGSPVSGISLSNRIVSNITRPSGMLADLCQIDIATQVEIEVSTDAGAALMVQAKKLADAIVDSDREQFDNFVGMIETGAIQSQVTKSL